MYHYGGNNPVKYVDPDGRDINDVDSELVMQNAKRETQLGFSEERITLVGCVLTAYTRIANAIGGLEITLEEANDTAKELGLYSNKNELTPQAGAKLINALLYGTGKSVTYAGSVTAETMTEYASFLNSLENSYSELYVTARIKTNDINNSKIDEHTVNINSNSVIPNDISDMSNALNIKINDTSGVRTQILNDRRFNKLERIDYFRLN